MLLNIKNKRQLLVAALAALLVFPSCGKHKKIFSSTCTDGMKVEHVSFRNLVDSMKFYDKQLVEVSGTYKEGKEESALVNDSLFVDHSNNHAFWINFSQECPLYLKGTRTGLFEYSDGKFTRLDNQRVMIRGIFNCRPHAGGYKASVDKISYIEF